MSVRHSPSPSLNRFRLLFSGHALIVNTRLPLHTIEGSQEADTDDGWTGLPTSVLEISSLVRINCELRVHWRNWAYRDLHERPGLPGFGRNIGRRVSRPLRAKNQ